MTVGLASDNRAVSCNAKLFQVEATGWIGNEIVKDGSLTLWENGCADSEFWDGREPDAITSDCFEHWDDVEPDQFDLLFASFLDKFRN